MQLALEAICAPVAAPDTWASALHQMERAANSVGCCFYPRDQARALLYLPVSSDLRDMSMPTCKVAGSRSIHMLCVGGVWPRQAGHCLCELGD